MHIMKEKKPPKEPSAAKAAKRPSLKEEDAALWGQVTQDVTRLSAANKVSKTAIKSPLARIKRSFLENISGQITLESFASSVSVHEPSSYQLDGNLQKRFQRGELSIDGKIDLHGLTLSQAHHAFLSFITRKIHEEARCILVVTGKGSQESENGRGIIRKNLPVWCDDTRLKPHILQFTSAHAKHGGSGAYYIMLRKRK